MKIIVRLNPSEPNLNVAFKPGDAVLCLMDSTNSDFTITLPLGESSLGTSFFMKKIVEINDITLAVQQPGKKIEDNDTMTIAGKLDSPHLESDDEGNWWAV